MNSNQILFSMMCGLFGTLVLTAQEKSKTYSERFNVSEDAVLEIDTSHADIEFETWDKNEVAITTTITLEGASEEEAEKYFESSPVEIKGNSKEIEVRTYTRDRWPSRVFLNDDALSNLRIESPDVQLLFEDLELPELPELMVLPQMAPMPPLPSSPILHFDYKKYKKDGDKYLKKWKKDFDKNFDEEYQKQLMEWSEEVKRRSESMKERIEERKVERLKLLEERREAQEERREALKEQREALRELRQASREKRSFILSQTEDEDGPTIFYLSNDGKDKKFKVKKSIKVKMPKSVKLKMNVKHGAVKLAALSKDIDARLRYASLKGSTIEGDATYIRASYSPIFIDQWNDGRLNTDYADAVELYEVGELDLNAVSSDVTIYKLKERARLKSNLGALRINNISNSFTDMKIAVQNGELHCKMPSTAYVVEVDGIASEVQYPKNLVLQKAQNLGRNVQYGYYLNKDGNKYITINSKFSDVLLED